MYESVNQLDVERVRACADALYALINKNGQLHSINVELFDDCGDSDDDVNDSFIPNFEFGQID